MINQTALRAQLISHLEAELGRDEGERRNPYQDTRGFWTIGIGHCLGTRNPLFVHAAWWAGISAEQEDALFQGDVADHASGLEWVQPWIAGLADDARHGVLLNMAFNLGVAGVLSFETFLGLCAAGNWAGAAFDLGNARVSRELPARYERLRRQLVTNEWQ